MEKSSSFQHAGMNIAGISPKPSYRADGNPYGTTNGEYQDKFLITELGEHSRVNERPQTDESERGTTDNQIFHVKDAEPPTDFEAPYSKLPSNVVLKRVKVTPESIILILLLYRKTCPSR